MIKKIKLSILGISYSQIQAGAYALVFSEDNGVRRLPIIVGTPEAQSIAMIMEHITPPRPHTHDLIKNILKTLEIELIEVLIYKYDNGAYYSELLLRQNSVEFRIDSRTSDAVAIALRTESPIYTTEDIMRNFGVIFDDSDTPIKDQPKDKNSDFVPEDISHIHVESLKKKLEQAIQDENYELASMLRDEISNRENKS